MALHEEVSITLHDAIMRLNGPIHATENKIKNKQHAANLRNLLELIKDLLNTMTEQKEGWEPYMNDKENPNA